MAGEKVPEGYHNNLQHKVAATVALKRSHIFTHSFPACICTVNLIRPDTVQSLIVMLQRQFDKALIPYNTLYGVTLITALRLGLIPAHRTRMCVRKFPDCFVDAFDIFNGLLAATCARYEEFVHLPLYEDMAPWNIVLQVCGATRTCVLARGVRREG